MNQFLSNPLRLLSGTGTTCFCIQHVAPSFKLQAQPGAFAVRSETSVPSIPVRKEKLQIDSTVLSGQLSVVSSNSNAPRIQ